MKKILFYFPVLVAGVTLCMTFPHPTRATAHPAVMADVTGSDSIPLPVHIDTTRQLFVDNFLISSDSGVTSRLHHPIRREQVMVYDKPWEGSGSDFQVLLRDSGIIRMYYTAAQLTNTAGTKMGGHPNYACYAESTDGIHWVKPDLGLFEFEGSKHNNIIWSMPRFDNFTPFRDPNPACKPDEKYKAVGAGKGGLFAFKSADGIHWSYLSDKPVITDGAFDSQNNAFWDPVRKHYWCYFRGIHQGVRDIRVSTSQDFQHWSTPERLNFQGAPDVALYTNQIVPYFRSPKLFLGFPTLYVERKMTPAIIEALPDPVHREARMKFSPRFGTALTDGLFMTSRDGIHFHRWSEPFIPPGPQRSNNWVYGDGYQSMGLLELPAEDTSAAPELSFYVGEGHWKDSPTLRRYTIRLDGFVSLHGGAKGGSILTKPLIFKGNSLHINFSTAVTGTLKVAVLTADGQPIPGFESGDCEELFGDSVDRLVVWNGKSDLSDLAGRSVRLKIFITQGDLYSLQFRD